jgi:undecaprenyl-diphosphatase
MNDISLIFLPLIQGLTEFLPVSSSGHLALFPHIFNVPDQGQRMDIALHVGTLAAILVYYWRDVWKIGFAVIQGPYSQDRQSQKLGLCIAFATIPAVIVGYGLHHFFPDGIRDVRVITATTIIFGLLMGLADILAPKTKTLKDIGWRNAFLIGCAQSVALVPGVSRSGVTITLARALGFEIKDAARFSFLLGIPAMVGAALLSLKDMLQSTEAIAWSEMGMAVGLSFLSGLAAIYIMMRWVSQWGLVPFAIYRMILGGFLFVYFIL